MIRFNLTIALTKEEFDLLHEMNKLDGTGITQVVEKIVKERLKEITQTQPQNQSLTLEL